MTGWKPDSIAYLCVEFFIYLWAQLCMLTIICGFHIAYVFLAFSLKCKIKCILIFYVFPHGTIRVVNYCTINRQNSCLNLAKNYNSQLSDSERKWPAYDHVVKTGTLQSAFSCVAAANVDPGDLWGNLYNRYYRNNEFKMCKYFESFVINLCIYYFCISKDAHQSTNI